jgi:hypothetical protein
LCIFIASDFSHVKFKNFYLLMRVRRESIVVMKRIALMILTDSYVFSPFEFEKLFSFNVVTLSVYVCASLPTERLDEFHSYSVFKGLSFIGRHPVKVDIYVRSQGPLPPNKMAVLSRSL